jgi:hypothetical protein
VGLTGRAPQGTRTVSLLQPHAGFEARAHRRLDGMPRHFAILVGAILDRAGDVRDQCMLRATADRIIRVFSGKSCADFVDVPLGVNS